MSYLRMQIISFFRDSFVIVAIIYKPWPDYILLNVSYHSCEIPYYELPSTTENVYFA